MIYARVETLEDKQELQLYIEEYRYIRKDEKMYRRLKIIQLSSRGKSVKELSERFKLCPHTIRDYIHRYNKQRVGVRALSPIYGKNRKLTTLTEYDWREFLYQNPSQFDKLNTDAKKWTQKLILDYVKEYHGISVTRTAISKCLTRLKIKPNEVRDPSFDFLDIHFVLLTRKPERKWTSNEDELLKGFYRRETNEELADRFDRTVHEVRKRLEDFGLRRRHHWTKEEEEELKQIARLTNKDIKEKTKKYSVTKAALRRKFIRLRQAQQNAGGEE